MTTLLGPVKHYTNLPERTQATKKAKLSDPSELSSSAPGKTLTLTPNAYLIKMTLDDVCSYPTPDKGAYIGYDFETNFKILAHRNFEHAYFYTDNPREAKFYHWTATTVAKTPSRTEFVAALEEYLEENDDFYLGARQTVSQFMFSLTLSEHSWLYNDTLYTNVISHFLKGGVTVTEGRLDNPEKIEELKESVRVKGLVSDVISLHSSTYTAAQVLALTNPDTILVSPRTTEYGQTLDVTQPRAPIPRNRKELFHALRKRTFQFDESLFHGRPFLLTTETGHREIFQELRTVPQRGITECCV